MNMHILTVSMAFLMAMTGVQDVSVLEKDSPVEVEINQPVRSITVNSNDQMKFDVKEIRVKAGEKIKLTLNHTGKLQKTVMGHNFVLLAAGTDVANFATAAMSAKATDYIPAKGALAHTKLIGGGESTTIEFTAPKKGTYDFICSFPGHYAIMKGKFIVE